MSLVWDVYMLSLGLGEWLLTTKMDKAFRGTQDLCIVRLWVSDGWISV